MKTTGSCSLSTINDINFFDIRCRLHTLCNLKCKFCCETKEKGIRENTKVNVDYIRQLSDEVITSIMPDLRGDIKNEISIGLHGGELFFDNIPDTLIDEYRKFIYGLRSKVRDTNMDVEISVYSVSNGVFTNRKRVETFLRDVNSRLMLSYDPIDRFSSDKQRETWYDTLNYFSDMDEFNVRISMVLTKKNIDACIDGDEMLDKVSSYIPIITNDYFPRLDYHGDLPSDDDLFSFYKWGLDNSRFNIACINNIIMSFIGSKEIVSCSQTLDHLFDETFRDKYQSGFIKQCVENPFNKEDYYGKCASEILDANDCLKYKTPLGMQKRGCLMCEYYSKCPKMCWTQVLFDKYEMSICPIERAYRYIESNPDILTNFHNCKKPIWQG